MSTMRQIARLFLEVKECLKNHSLQNEIEFKDMFTRKNMKIIKKVIHERKQDKRFDSLLYLGNSMKKFVRFLYDHLTNEGLDADATEAERFLSSLKYNWSELFGESEYEVVAKRMEIRKPSALPDEKDLKVLTHYVKSQLKKLSKDSYAFIAEEEFTFLRDLLVCRLTLFNARRGGEPSRLTVKQWMEASNDVWTQNNKASDIDLSNNYKVAYQPGKHDGKLVPVMFPNDCHNALSILCNSDIRKDAGVNKYNLYLFPRTNFSERHCIGSDCIRNICMKAGISSITATKVRHRAATIHASMDTTDLEKEAFFRHMGHSDKINKNVYQCPPAVMEVTKVGNFFKKLDEELDIQTNTSNRLDNSLQTPSTSTEIEKSSLKDFLCKVADSDAVGRVLVNNIELITEEEVETVPGIKVTEACMNSARPLFTDDAWLVVKTTLDCVNKYQGKKHDEAAIHRHKSQSEKRDNEKNSDSGSDYELDVRAQTNIFEPSSDSDDYNDQNIQTSSSSSSSKKNSKLGGKFAARKTLKKSKTDINQPSYVRWCKRDREKIVAFFSNYIDDVSRFDAKGILPGQKEIRKFLRIHPDVLSELPVLERIKKIHTKLYNERNKSRRLARKTLHQK